MTKKKKIIIICTASFLVLFSLWFAFSDTGKMLRYVIPLKLSYEYSAEYGSTDEETLEDIRKLAYWYYNSFNDIDSHCSARGGRVMGKYWKTVGAHNYDIMYTTENLLKGKSSKFKKQLLDEVLAELKAICDANMGDLDAELVYNSLGVDDRLYAIGECFARDYYTSFFRLPIKGYEILDTEYLQVYITVLGDRVWDDVGDLLEHLDGYIGDVSDFEHTKAAELWKRCYTFLWYTDTNDRIWRDGSTFHDLLVTSRTRAIIKHKNNHTETENNQASNNKPYSGGYNWNDDYYDVYDYDDPDDFAFDWEDEFDDYDDAYDYWEEHHE